MESVKPEFCRGTENEILFRRDYETVFRVEENDIVVDIGSSAGLFAHTILKYNPCKVFCVEPQKDVYELLVDNVGSNNAVTCINCGIGPNNQNRAITDYETCLAKKHNFSETNEVCNYVTFKTFIKDNNINKIDFLKVDCEGGEYDIFTSENIEWIKKNVRKIAAEIHLNTNEERQKFLIYRENFLKHFSNYQVYSFGLANISNEVFKEHFIHTFQYVYVFIDNR